MSFGSLKIFPFPAVQYIPLSLTTICSGSILHANPRTIQPQLVIDRAIYQWQPILEAEYGIDNIESKKDVLPIIALNLEIVEIKYRGFYVTMTGKEKVGYYQYCTIPRNYFYKKNLFFELFDLSTAKRLASTTCVV